MKVCNSIKFFHFILIVSVLIVDTNIVSLLPKHQVWAQRDSIVYKLCGNWAIWHINALLRGALNKVHQSVIRLNFLLLFN